MDVLPQLNHGEKERLVGNNLCERVTAQRVGGHLQIENTSASNQPLLKCIKSGNREMRWRKCRPMPCTAGSPRVETIR
eukprot:283953-Heterocapsa_arctica.AAC.1